MITPSPKITPTPAMFKEIKLLKSFNDREHKDLIQLGVTQPFEAHSNIVIEGEMSWGLYLILDGLVGIFKNNKLTGESYDVGQLGPGNFFGEMSLVDENPRSATVKALTDCTVFYMSKDVFVRFLDRSADLQLKFYTSCIKTLVTRLRELDDNYVVSQYQLWKRALKKEAA